MPQYRVHNRFNLFLFLPLFLFSLWYFFHPQQKHFIVFAGSFAYATLFMNPDLDLAHQIRFFSLRGFLTLPFRFYSYIFRHRGLSHSVFFGTITRILWICLVSLSIYYLIYQTFIEKKTIFIFIKQNKEFILYGVLGLFLADFCHIALDKRFFFSGKK